VTEPGGKRTTVWQELIQRRVVRVAIFYGAIAWVLVQVADVVLEAFEADAALKYVIALAVAGFPLALVLSWMFDITPQGVVRTPARDSEKAAPRSIAVLPFANLSDDADNEYFSDGLADEIRDRIGQVAGVRVAARSSSAAFKGKVVDAREIGRPLNVALLLEGGVRRFRDTLRVSAQLVDAQRGYQVWSHSYERRLEDVFAVQTEIARSILEAVHIRVLDGGVADAGPANFEAYNLYLQGRFHFHKRTEASLTLAVRYFRRALEQDPGYAQAHSGLADALCLQSTGFYGNMCAEEALAEALPAAKRALELAPDSAEAHATIGLISQLQQDFDGAVASLERAISLNPNYALAYVWLGLAHLSQRRYAEAERRNAEVLRLDPLSPIVNANSGFDAFRHGRYDEAEKRFRNVIELDPTFPVAYSGLARVRVTRGEVDDALRWQEKAIERAPTVAYYLARKGYILLQAGRTDAARKWFDTARTSSLDKHFLSDIFVGVAIATDDRDSLRAIAADQGLFGEPQRALALLTLGDPTAALALYEQDCPDHATVLHEIVNYEMLWRIPHANFRALAKRRNGDESAAADIEAYLDAARVLWDQAIVNPDIHYWAAASHALLGRHDEACAELGKACELGWRSTWWAARDPCMDALREDDRYIRIIAEAEELLRVSAAGIRANG
jgi:TolB-like protein/Tfp pilus assembly protein PilF